MSNCYIADSHCHLSPSCTEKEALTLADLIDKKWGERLGDGLLHIMSTNRDDVDLLDIMLDKTNKRTIVAYFGVHPWYSHLFSFLSRNDFESDSEFALEHYRQALVPVPSEELLNVLPVPRCIHEHIQYITSLVRKHLGRNIQIGIGEIGLDKLFRLPKNGYHGNKNIPEGEDRLKFTNYRVSMAHQVRVLESHLSLANELRLPVSIHCVKAHGLLYDHVTTEAYSNIPNVLLHSFTGSSEQVHLWVKEFSKRNQSLRFSLSNWINGATARRKALEEILSVVSDDQILVETDYGIDSYLLEEELFKFYLSDLDAIFQKICNIKGWEAKEGKEIIFNNWKDSLTREF